MFSEILELEGVTPIGRNFNEEMGVSINGGTPSHHPYVNGIFAYKPSILGIPIYGNPQMMMNMKFRASVQNSENVTSLT